MSIALIVECLTLVLALAMGAIAGSRLSAPVLASPWLLPLLVSIVMSLIAVALIFGEIAERRKAAGSPAQRVAEGALQPQGYRMIGWLGLCSAYAIATPWVGFEWATLVFMPVALWAFGRASWPVIGALTLAMALALPLIFRHVFQSLVP